MKNLNVQFGNKKVTESQKTKLVQSVFSNVYEKYDLMNDLMSFGTHRLWKKILIDQLNIQDNEKIIDVGSGTGDIGIKILELKPSVEIVLCDFNSSMLKYNKENFIKKKNINFVKANAEDLPFENNYFDKYVSAFCYRNITDMNQAMKESYRILKPGGQFACLEFSTITNPMLNKFYRPYLNNFIPYLGDCISKRRDEYKYLAESINNFPNQDIISNKLKQIGYFNVSFINLFNGIVSIHRGWKT